MSRKEIPLSPNARAPLTTIHETTGKLAEFAPLALPLYSDCDHNCIYCAGPQECRNRVQPMEPPKDLLKALARDVEILRESEDDREILIGCPGDPYQPLEADLSITRRAIEILIDAGLTFTVLTKGGTLAVRDFDLLEGYPNASFGSNLIFISQDDADRWEPGAPTISDRIDAIGQARERGIRTWVSLEPVIDSAQILELIRELHSIVDLWRLVIDPNWKDFREDAIALLDSFDAEYHINGAPPRIPTISETETETETEVLPASSPEVADFPHQISAENGTGNSSAPATEVFEATSTAAAQADANNRSALSPEEGEWESSVIRVRRDAIATTTPDDLKYIFRVTTSPDSQIRELADSIRDNGLIHPLVLLRTAVGTYRIICGYRRFQALTLLEEEFLPARVHTEEELSEQQRILISLAENTRRRNLNPVEIGYFLESAHLRLSLPNRQLADRFGSALGLGSKEGKVSHATISKYRAINRVREEGESDRIIEDVIRGVLPFGVAAEILAPIREAGDRNALYEQVVLPFKPSRPQLRTIKEELEPLASGLAAALAGKEVRDALIRAKALTRGRNRDLIRRLKLINDNPLLRKREAFSEQAAALRETILGPDATESDFKIVPTPRMNRNELSIQVRITEDNFDEALQSLQKLWGEDKFRDLLSGISKD